MRQSRSVVSMVLLAGAMIPLGPWPSALADEPAVEEQLVDDLQNLFGRHPGQRTNHAKGIVVEGEFAAAPQAASLSRAAHLQAGSTVPVTVRFSAATGLPEIPDGHPQANPHGMAVKFRLPDSSDTDIVINSLHFFPVATAAEFHEFLTAAAATKPDSPKPTKLDEFFAAHPAAKRAGATTKTPASYATEEYFGINAFQLVNAAGERRSIRYVMEPAAGVSHLDPASAAQQPPNFLSDDLRQRLNEGPVRFRLLAQVAAPEDPTADATIAWPETRQRVELGTLTITRAAADNEAAAKELLFLPGQLTDGIEPSDDPLIAVRDGVYAVSFSRRSE
jgi:catalase